MKVSMMTVVLGSLISIAANAQSLIATKEILIAPKTTETRIRSENVMFNPADFESNRIQCSIQHAALAMPRVIREGSTFQITDSRQSALTEIPLAQLRQSMEWMNGFAYPANLTRSELHDHFKKMNNFAHPDKIQKTDFTIKSDKTNSTYKMSCESNKSVTREEILSRLYEIQAEIQMNPEL